VANLGVPQATVRMDMHRNASRLPVRGPGRKSLTHLWLNGSDLQVVPGLGKSTYCQRERSSQPRTARRGQRLERPTLADDEWVIDRGLRFNIGARA
jgi:hypothetical protein